jgi:hypothetical protein
VTPKTKMLLDISKEQEQKFKYAILKVYPRNIVDGIDVYELFKMIRSAEYRRGKEENLK